MFGHESMRFADRSEAGRRLAERLRGLHLDRPIIYALPRGGVPVAAEIASALDAPLDLVLGATVLQRPVVPHCLLRFCLPLT